MLLPADIDELRTLATRIARSAALSSYEDSGDKDTMVAACAAVLAVAQGACQQLLIERNASIAVNKLPLEILGTVLRHVQVARRKEWPNSNPLAPPVKASLVCTHWRSVTLATPLLWSVITCRRYCPPDLLSSFLNRSWNVALSLYYLDEPCSYVVSENMHRIRVLRVESLGSACLSVALGRPAPLLERLELQECTEGFPPGFLGDHAPNLRILVLPSRSLLQGIQYPALRQVNTVDVRGSGRGILPALFDQCPQITTIVEVTDYHALGQDYIPNRIEALHAEDNDLSAGLSALLRMFNHRDIGTISLHLPLPSTIATALEGLHAILHFRVSWNSRPYYHRQRWWIELVDERGHVRTFHFDDRDPAWHLASRLKTDFAVSWSLRSFSIALPSRIHQELPTLTYNLRAVESLSIGIASADDLDVPLFITDCPAVRYVRVTALLIRIRLSAATLAEFLRKLMERIGQRPIDVLRLDNITIEATPESALRQSPLAALVQTIVETNDAWESAAIVSIV